VFVAVKTENRKGGRREEGDAEEKRRRGENNLGFFNLAFGVL